MPWQPGTRQQGWYISGTQGKTAYKTSRTVHFVSWYVDHHSSTWKKARDTGHFPSMSPTPASYSNLTLPVGQSWRGSTRAGRAGRPFPYGPHGGSPESACLAWDKRRQEEHGTGACPAPRSKSVCCSWHPCNRSPKDISQC